MSSSLYNSLSYSEWPRCHYCNSTVAVLDRETNTCGPSCKAKLFTGLKHLRQSQTGTGNNIKLKSWLDRHPQIKKTYETDQVETDKVVQILSDITINYDKGYMNNLFNSWN